MPPSPSSAKKAVACPKCGADQQEPAGAVSTFCRSCGHHFEVGRGADGREVYLRDIWPTSQEIAAHLNKARDPAVYRDEYGGIDGVRNRLRELRNEVTRLERLDGINPRLWQAGSSWSL